MTRGELTTQLASRLGAHHEARVIVDEVLGRAVSGDVSDEAVARAASMAERCRAGEPLQYVLGHWSFRTLDLAVDPRVLIPRPETEQVVEVALHELRRLDAAEPVVVDAGTGSGAIALSLAVELAAGSVYALDASADALAVARANCEEVRRLEAGMLPVTFFEGSWLEQLPASLWGAVTMVVANPPYVAEAEWDELAVEVRAEPRRALVAGAGSDGTPGLADVEAVLAQALLWVARPGAVVIELAPHQAEAAGRMAASMGYLDVEVRPDLAQRPRALVGRLR